MHSHQKQNFNYYYATHPNCEIKSADAFFMNNQKPGAN